MDLSELDLDLIQVDLVKVTYGPDQTGGRRSELRKAWDTRYLSTWMSTHGVPVGFPPFPPVASCDIVICNKKYILGLQAEFLAHSS